MNKVAISEREKQILRNYLLGGIGIGGGGALLASAAGYADTLRKQKEQVDTSRDDDVLYVTLPGKRPTPAKEASAVTGLAIAGGLTSALAAAYLARRLMQTAKKDDMQRELDLAQGANYRQMVGTAPAKAAAAGRPVGQAELLLSSPAAIAALLMAASAGVTYKTMDAKFGKKPKPVSSAPKRVVYRYANEEADEGGQAKVAFELPLEALQGQATALAACLAKQANTHSALADVLGAVCEGRLDELEHNILQNPHLALDLVKGAADAFFTAPAQLQALAVKAACVSPALEHTTLLLTLAELEDNAAWSFKSASAMPDSDMDYAMGQMGLVVAADIGTTLERSEFIGTEAQHATYRDLLDRASA